MKKIIYFVFLLSLFLASCKEKITNNNIKYINNFLSNNESINFEKFTFETDSKYFLFNNKGNIKSINQSCYKIKKTFGEIVLEEPSSRGTFLTNSNFEFDKKGRLIKWEKFLPNGDTFQEYLYYYDENTGFLKERIITQFGTQSVAYSKKYWKYEYSGLKDNIATFTGHFKESEYSTYVSDFKYYFTITNGEIEKIEANIYKKNETYLINKFENNKLIKTENYYSDINHEFIYNDNKIVEIEISHPKHKIYKESIKFKYNDDKISEITREKEKKRILYEDNMIKEIQSNSSLQMFTYDNNENWVKLIILNEDGRGFQVERKIIMY